MEIVAKKRAKKATVDNTKSPGGSFFKPAPGHVQQTGGNATTFFKQVPGVNAKQIPGENTTAKQAPRAKLELSPALKNTPQNKPGAGKAADQKSGSNAGESLVTLQSTPASKLPAAFNTAKTNIAKSQNQQQKEAYEKIPKVAETEGSIYGGNIKGLNKHIPKKGNAALKKEPGQFKEPYQKAGSISLPPTPVIPANTIFSLGSSEEDVAAKASTALDNVVLDTSSVPDTVGPVQEIDLSGEANPNLMNEELAEQETDVSKNKEDAAKEINNDFGENNVVPKPTNAKIKVKKKRAAVKPFAKKTAGLKKITDITSKIDIELAPGVNEKIGEEKTKADAEELKFTEQSEAEYTSAQEKIQTESLQSRQKQFDAGSAVVTNVNGARVEWRSELDGVEVQYKNDAALAGKSHKKLVDDKVELGNKDIKKEQDSGNKEIADKKANAEKEAKEEKEKKRKSSGGFFGWLKSKAAALIDLVKKAFNFIMDNLRKAVKFVIDRIKDAINFIIDKIRDAVVGFIKAFGAVLKGLVNIAFAAFPKIRDKINSKIDKFVDKAVELTNAAFDAFKEAVNAIIDFVADVIDSLLAAVQAIYNFILDVVEFLVVGLIAIIEFIANLNIAAALSPSKFFGSLAEESLGGDPASPIPDIEVPLGQEKQWAAAMGLEPATGAAQGQDAGISPAILSLLTKDQLEDGDVVLEPYPAVEMDTVMLNSLPPMQEGQKLELGGAGENSVTTLQFQQDAANSAGLTIDGGTQTQAPGMAQTNALTEPLQQVPNPDWINMTDEDKLQHYNNQILVESAKAGNEEPKPDKVTPELTIDNSPEALITKTGRLGVGRRLEFMGEQMLAGIKAFWNKYKAWIIAGLVVALIAIAAILFFSGGTALGLVVEAIGEALLIIFGAIAVARAMGSIWDYVKKAWAGDTDGAAKALATAFAIIVVEFFIDKILLGFGKVFKRILKAFKATKIGRFVRKAIIVVKKVQRATGKIISKGISKLRGTKLVLFIEKIVAKGVNKLDDLRNKILAKFGFKRIWLEKHGGYKELWGEFNAKVLMVKARIDENNNSYFTHSESSIAGKTSKADGKIIGKQISPQEVIVSDEFARRLDDLRKTNPVKYQEELDKINDALKAGKTEQEIREMVIAKREPFDREKFLQKHPDAAKTADAIQKRGTLNSNLDGHVKKPAGADWEAHHLIPVEVLAGTDEAGDIMRKAIDDGFDFNCSRSDINGQWQQRYSSETRLNEAGETIASSSGTHASHPKYTEEVQKKLVDLVKNRGFSPKAAAEEIAKEMRDKIAITPGIVINELFKP